jgi:hypothetical protein
MADRAEMTRRRKAVAWAKLAQRVETREHATRKYSRIEGTLPAGMVFDAEDGAVVQDRDYA